MTNILVLSHDRAKQSFSICLQGGRSDRPVPPGDGGARSQRQSAAAAVHRGAAGPGGPCRETAADHHQLCEHTQRQPGPLQPPGLQGQRMPGSSLLSDPRLHCWAARLPNAGWINEWKNLHNNRTTAKLFTPEEKHRWPSMVLVSNLYFTRFYSLLSAVIWIQFQANSFEKINYDIVQHTHKNDETNGQTCVGTQIRHLCAACDVCKFVANWNISSLEKHTDDAGQVSACTFCCISVKGTTVWSDI